MVWTSIHDEMLCREILVTNLFTGTKKVRLREARNGSKLPRTSTKLNWYILRLISAQ